MQEEVTQGTITLSIRATKMTAELLQKALKQYLAEKAKHSSQLYQGKQTLGQLKRHGVALSNIEITEQNIKAFSQVAKKYEIDYALKKDPNSDPPHYYVFFKARDKDQLEPAFREFTAKTLNRAPKPSIRKLLAQARAQAAEKIQPRTLDREKVRERERGAQL